METETTEHQVLNQVENQVNVEIWEKTNNGIRVQASKEIMCLALAKVWVGTNGTNGQAKVQVDQAIGQGQP